MLYLLLKDLQRKAARIVASKCALAARVDSFHESPRGEVGQGQLSKLWLLLYYVMYNIIFSWLEAMALIVAT